MTESYNMDDAKRLRVLGDIPLELVNEVMSTITDPAAMLGPEVRASHPICINSCWELHDL